MSGPYRPSDRFGRSFEAEAPTQLPRGTVVGVLWKLRSAAVPDLTEAQQVLEDRLSELLGLGYEALAARLGRSWRLLGGTLMIGGHNVEVDEQKGPSGASYRVRAEWEWDDKPDEAVLVEVSVEDAHGSEVLGRTVLSEEVLVAPDGSVKRPSR